jgi:YVTN family beta-propeller protein
MMRLTITTVGAALFVAGTLFMISARAGDEPRREMTWPGLTPAGSVLLPNGWSLKPAGRQLPLGDLPVQIAVHPSEPVLAVLHAGYGAHEIITLDAQRGDILGRVALPQTFSGLVWSADGKRLYASGGFDDCIYRFDQGGGLLSNRWVLKYDEEGDAPRCPAGLALTVDGRILYVANAFSHQLAAYNTSSGKLLQQIPLGAEAYPYGLALDEGATRLYVSLWGRAEVAVVNLSAFEVAARVPVQEHPNEMRLARQGTVLYVANANRNTVSVVDTLIGKVIETIGTAIDPRASTGCTPSSLALSPDENVLFVANANTNDVAVVNVKDRGASAPLGFVPTGWYPTSVRVSRDGSTLYIANGKGGTSKANRDGPRPGFGGNNRLREYIGSLFQGTLSLVPMPSPTTMARYSQTVYECSPIRRGDPTAVSGPVSDGKNAIPARVGDPSPITHCVYIIKENRTYDQVFGDMSEGNGDRALCLFPEKVTPNHHALAREFVLLDSFYVESEVSADGHEWSMGAYATDFVERTWPINYRGEKRMPYPAEGAFAIARPAEGYLWDRAAAKGVGYRSYGEFIDNGPTPDDPATTRIKALEGHFDPKFRSYDLDYPDVKRAERFLEELAGFEKTGEMPRLIVLRLPNDHTSGTARGKPTPTAFLADNDLALGQVVEGLSKSRFWPHLAIFVVEDDAQNGSDHVDAHRTVALAISPYIRRKSIDSTLYSTSSMLRTMELILGLEPMSQFDAAARPMYAAFTGTPDLKPYEHRPPGVDVKATNLATAWGAEASERLNLEIEDRADDLVFNEIIWKSVKGADSPMPPPVRAAFVIPRASSKDKD